MENELLKLVLNGKDYELDAYLENTSTSEIRNDVLNIMTMGGGKRTYKECYKEPSKCFHFYDVDCARAVTRDGRQMIRYLANGFDSYKYSPKEDISVYELALILPLFHSNSSVGFNMGVENLPEWVKRHFMEI